MNILTPIFKIFQKRASSGTNKQQGTIKFFDRKKRFGFIIAGQKEYFFHASAAKPEDIKRLRDGANVRFMLIQGKKGPQADAIEIAS